VRVPWRTGRGRNFSPLLISNPTHSTEEPRAPKLNALDMIYDVPFTQDLQSNVSHNRSVVTGFGRWPNRGPGGAAAGNGVCDFLRHDAGSGTLLRNGDRIRDFHAGRVEDSNRGPTGAFVVVVAGAIAMHGVAGLFICTMMAGVLLVLLGEWARR
jgi:hypothetical protein